MRSATLAGHTRHAALIRRWKTRVGRGAALASAAVLVAGLGAGVLGQGTASAAPRAAARARPVIHFGQAGRRPAAPDGVVASWDTGSCPGFLPGSSAYAPPGDVDSTWAPLQAEAEQQVEELYGQTSDTLDLYSTDYARGVTRAFMFVDLVQAIDAVAAGTATATQTSEVSAFAQVVQYGREWVALDASNLFDAETSAPAEQSVVTNDVFEVIFGFLGLPWQDQDVDPSVTQLMNEAQGALWNSPATATDADGNQFPNYPLGGAESQQAVQQALNALTFLSAIGEDDSLNPSAGTNSSLDSAMAEIENALGSAGGGGTLAGAVVQISDIASELAGIDGTTDSSLIESLVNVVWQGADTAATGIQITNNQNLAQALPSPSDLQGDLENVSTFEELFDDFVALTLHTSANAAATGNDPDCRTEDKVRDGTTPLGPTSSDPTMAVIHTTAAGTEDYAYETQTLGGYRTDSTPTSEIKDPSPLDWSLTRDGGPGAPRLGTNWPISQVTYGVPGPPGDGYLLDSPSDFYPGSGSWYLTFNGANGQQYQTAPLTVYTDSSGTVHPTDSEVEQAIINADPTDFPQQACSGPDASDLDPAVPPNDQGQGPCTDWDPATHTGTDLLVSGDQPDNNHNGSPDYQTIFDIMVKGDLGGWDPVFTAHTSTCGTGGGICVYSLAFGIPLVGENINSQVLWPYQQNDVCVNDPVTCSGNATFGWGDQSTQVNSSLTEDLPQPYPVSPECQAVSPVAGMFQLQYVGEEGGNPGCDANADAASWVMSPSFTYRSEDGSYWTAWRVPPSVNSSYSFLNVEDAAVQPGTAAIDPNCGPEQAGDANATCLIGEGTHWSSEFAPGDQIVLQDPNDPAGNGTGGMLSIVRTVQTVVDDTHMILSTSAECLSGSDGNDCDFFNTSAYTSFMNPADGDQGDQAGMITLPCGDECVSAPPNFQFDIKKLTALNAGTDSDCAVWSPSSTDSHPPASGCYFSDLVQFQAQDGTSNGWWDVVMNQTLAGQSGHPSLSALLHSIGRSHARHPAAGPAGGNGTWVNAPVITAQPQSTLAGAGDTATFTVRATGSPTPKIQWQVSTDGSAKWANISGATSASYQVAVSAGDSGADYRAVVSNANGSRTSQWATLSVAAAPVITKDPKPTATLHRGDTFSFDSAATGDPAPAPTWQISQDGGKTWQVLETGRADISFSLPSSPAAGAALRPAGSSVLKAHDLVRVTYQNAYGSATSPAVALNFQDTYPDVGVSASVSPNPVAAGLPATALITVGDYSGVKATDVSAAATFSSSLGLKSVKQVSGPKASCTMAAATGGETETCTWASLAGNAQAQFKATLAPVKTQNDTGTIDMDATLSQQDGIPATANLNVPIRRPWAGLQLTGKGPKTEKVLSRWHDVLTVHNGGPAAAAKATVTISVPANVRLVKAAGKGAKCAVRGGTVTCRIARIAVGRSVKITLTLQAHKKGSSLLTATVGAVTPDYVTSNDSAAISTVIKG